MSSKGVLYRFISLLVGLLLLNVYGILAGGMKTGDIWDELGGGQYQGLTERNSNRYYRYNVRNGPNSNVYAFKINTLKDYSTLSVSRYRDMSNLLKEKHKPTYAT